jgi:alpha-L-rhamnosidase
VGKLGAIDENGTVSTYSYNHYAFGCIGDWMYRYLGGLTAVEPGYRTFEVAPHFDCGLTEVSASENTPYGRVSVNWRLVGTEALVHVEVPVNTTARIHLPGQTSETGSGIYNYLVHLNG